ncbi:hypothetical protein TRFO_27663 [Tritrichomonas foetus]|uniref:Uncharacterized protein n=1 Tax=Tritrichomonas foetus TaxID=1144522 RepID=A0A1J4K0M8_9EUKA|nr:hypothetical protein TRFO_27663 [Tritrichomonas foetus]|eukprot:OHT04803.1 hypothetical protein TRFO_27663 [Tritrichomonas foetus]
MSKKKEISEQSILGFLIEDNVTSLQEEVSNGLDVNQQFFWILGDLPDILTNSPPLISVAAFHRAVNCFNYLTKEGADIHKLDEMETPISNFAVAGGNMEIIQILDQHGVDFSKTLKIAAEYGHFEIFIWIFQNKGLDLQERDQYNRTFLHIAAAGGNTQLVKFLIEKGLDVNGIDGVFIIIFKLFHENIFWCFFSFIFIGHHFILLLKSVKLMLLNFYYQMIELT